MSSYNEQLQSLANKYIAATGKITWTTREIAKWAIDSGYWKPHPEKLITLCSEEFGRAFREEYYTDPQGRRVRVKHVAKIPQNGKQIPLWVDIRNEKTKRAHIEISFTQRIHGIIADCVQLDTDKDSYNENQNDGVPINFSFDFTEPVEEAKITRANKSMRVKEKLSSSEPLHPSLQSSGVEQKSTLQPVPSRL